MFQQSFSGTYKDIVKWFAGVAENIVHVTLHTMDNDHIFYDFMTNVNGDEDFKHQLENMCESYISRFINIPQIPESVPVYETQQ
jgi:hypothetical protein